MTGRTLGCVVACGWLMAGSALQAHHSLAGVYDMKKESEIAGSVEKVQFVNPHGSLTLAVKNPDGTSTNWVSRSARRPRSRREASAGPARTRCTPAT